MADVNKNVCDHENIFVRGECKKVLDENMPAMIKNMLANPGNEDIVCKEAKVC